MNVHGLLVSRDVAHHRVGSQPARRAGQFRFNTISALVLTLFMGAGLGLQGALSELPDAEGLAYFASGVLGAAAILFVLPYWPVVIVIIGAIWAALPVAFEVDLLAAASVLTIGLLVSPGIEIVKQWDRICQDSIEMSPL